MSTYAIATNGMQLEGKLPEGDGRWAKFNASFRNRWLEPGEFATAVKCGMAYTSWHDPMYRHSDNWQLSQFLAVDLDTGDEKSSIPYLLDQDFVVGFGTLIHTTPSHTPEKPRARVVFFLDRPIVRPEAYSNAAKFLSKILGGDKVATDPSRFYYGNVNAQLELLRGQLPVDYLYTLYQKDKALQERLEKLEAHQDRKNGNAPKASHNKDYNAQRGGSQGVSHGRRDEVEKLLAMIDPMGIEYMDWVAAIGAIKHELGDDGLRIAEQWAMGKKGEVEKMWRSMRRGDGGNVSTFGTLCHLAYPGH